MASRVIHGMGQGEAGWSCGNWLVLTEEGDGAALRFLTNRDAMPWGSSRHGMLESIPPWMAAGLLLLCNTRLLVVC